MNSPAIRVRGPSRLAGRTGIDPDTGFPFVWVPIGSPFDIHFEEWLPDYARPRARKYMVGKKGFATMAGAIRFWQTLPRPEEDRP